jgi:hypothetical protein
MRKLLMLVAVLALTGSLAGQVQHESGRQSRQAKPEQKQGARSTPNVAGKWTMTLEMSMGTATPALELKQDGDKITGTYTGRYGTSALEGKLKESNIEFATTISAEGQPVTLTFTGEVAPDGQTMKGTASLGELGDATWSAKRDKATDTST